VKNETNREGEAEKQSGLQNFVNSTGRVWGHATAFQQSGGRSNKDSCGRRTDRWLAARWSRRQRALEARGEKSRRSTYYLRRVCKTLWHSCGGLLTSQPELMHFSLHFGVLWDSLSHRACVKLIQSSVRVKVWSKKHQRSASCEFRATAIG
jgi:hypothetical protein